MSYTNTSSVYYDQFYGGNLIRLVKLKDKRFKKRNLG